MKNDQYLEQIKQKLGLDKLSLTSVSDDLERAVKGGILRGASKSNIENSVKQLKTTSALIKEINRQIDEYSNVSTKEARQFVKNLKSVRRELGGKAEKSDGNLFTQKLTDISGMFLSKLKGIFTDAWDELSTLLNFSKLSNAETRNLAFSYGFSSSQAYGFTQAKSLLGVSSDEDIFYMNAQERQQFYDAFTKYTQKYDQLYESGFFKTLQDYQVEMQEFQLDMRLNVAEFFIDNKDAIKAGMNALMTLAEWTVKGFSFLIERLSFGSTASSASDIVNNYASRSVNVKIDNTFNGTTKEIEANVGNVWKNNLAQIIQALG